MTKVSLADHERLADISDGLVSHNLILPQGSDMERVFIHPERLLKLGRAAGASSIHLCFDDDYVPPPDFIDVEYSGGGSATMKGLFKHKEYFGAFEYDDHSNPFKTTSGDKYAKTNDITDLSRFYADKITIKLPKQELRNKVTYSTNNVRGPLDEKLWALELSRSVDHTVRNAVKYRFGSSSTSAKKGSLESHMREAWFATETVIPILVLSFLNISSGEDPAVSQIDVNPLLGSIIFQAVLVPFIYLISMKDGRPVPSVLVMSHLDMVPRGLLKTLTTRKTISYDAKS